MTAQDVARLEAVRATCLAALTAAQAALQTVDAMLMTDDREVMDGDNSNPWSTFDEDDTKETTHDNGQKASKRR